MKTARFFRPDCLLLATTLILATTDRATAENWPSWRGPDGTGNIQDEDAYPTTWNGKTGENILWKAPLPAPGNSSPIVWNDHVFVTTSFDMDGKRRALMAFDRKDGTRLWETAIEFPENEPTHKTNPHCAATPATDGELVYVSFGSAGVMAFDFEGKIRWKTDLGRYHHIWGNASSPVLYKDTVIIFGSPGPLVTLSALDKETGEVRWKEVLTEAEGKEPKEWKGSWATPLIWNNRGRDEILLPLPQKLCGFDPANGDLLWHCEGMTDLAYTDSYVGGNLAVGMSGYKGAAFATEVPAPGEKAGDVTSSRLWRVEKNPQRIGSGVVVGDHLYMVNEPGVGQCIELKSGEVKWEERVGRSTWSSLIHISGHIYSTDITGTTHVFKPEVSEYRSVASNPVAGVERTNATPAFSDGQIFIRTHEHLYAIGIKK